MRNQKKPCWIKQNIFYPVSTIMRKIYLIPISLLFSFNLFGQESPYKIYPLIDVPVAVAGIGTGLWGFSELKNKSPLDSAYVASLSPNDVNAFDRGATRTNRHSSLKTDGDVLMYSSFAAPLLFLADKKVNKNALKVGFLYIETMIVTANIYTWGVGSFNRVRPYVYNPKVPIQEKLNNKTKDSFFAGHPFATAAATFFVAKVFHDYHPDSKLRKFIWAGALILPGTVAYFRYKNGEHFPTDILVGIPLGAIVGIIVPQLHKTKKESSVKFYPTPRGIGMVYKF
jgi:hypothetical protein